MALSRAQIDALLADNVNGDISAEDMRDVAGALYDVADVLRGDRTMWTDFIGGGNSVEPFTASNATGAQTNRAVLDGTEWGVFDFFTGASSTGRGAIFGGTTSVAFGTNEFRVYGRIYLPDLSTTGEAYSILFGFGDTVTSVDQTDAACMIYTTEGVYTSSASSANWQTLTASNSSRTYTTSSTAVAEDTWMTLEIRVNAAASSVAFYVDDTEIVTAHTANIPSGASRATGPQLRILKSAGTTSRNMYADYFGVRRLA